MVDALVELRHLLSLPLPKVKEILALAFDPENTCSLPSQLEELQREDLNTAKARFLAGRILGDALSVGAVRLAREIEEPLSQATCERARSTLDATIAFLRDSLGVLLPSSSPSSLAPIIPPAGILPSGARRDDGAHRPQGAARVVGAGFDGHSTSSGFDVLEDLSEECPHDSGDDECYKTVEGGTPIGFTPIIPPAASEPGSDVGPAGAC